MHDARYYREQAERLRELARDARGDNVGRDLERLAADFDEVADDLDNGRVEIVRPDLLPQRNRPPRA